jgi:hypothetical protein
MGRDWVRIREIAVQVREEDGFLQGPSFKHGPTRTTKLHTLTNFFVSRDIRSSIFRKRTQRLAKVSPHMDAMRGPNNPVRCPHVITNEAQQALYPARSSLSSVWMPACRLQSS